MKYLRSFNEAISNDIIEYLRDICLELTDVGFTIRIGCEDLHSSGRVCRKVPGHQDQLHSVFTNHCGRDLQLEISKESKRWIHAGSVEGVGCYLYFDYQDIEDVVERIRDYMESEGYSINIDKKTSTVDAQRKRLWIVDIKFIKNK